MSKYISENFYSYVAGTSDSPVGIEVERASGMHLFSTSGKKYLDMIAGISVCNMGHSHPAIVEAVKRQAERYMHVMVYGEMIEEPQVELATLLCRYLPDPLSSVYFVNSGAEAVEGALKLAKRVTGRQEIIHCHFSYHGCTQGAMSVMGSETFKNAFRPLLPRTKAIRFGCKEDLEQITVETACFIVETIQGEAGIRIAGSDYWEAVRRRCDETGTLLILDEIQTGMGRTGKLFCFEHYTIKPDILLLAKALGGGMPLGAFISSKEYMDMLKHDPVLGHMTTFGGHPVSCAAALAHMQLLTDGRYWEEAERKGQQLEDYLSALEGVKEIRRMGLMMAVDFYDEKVNMDIYKKWLDAGIFTDWFLFCNTALRIAPPLIIGEEDMAEFFSLIENIV